MTPISQSQNGFINTCHSCSYICHYRCCHQSLPDDSDFGPENAILLYPGEWELVEKGPRSHLIITLDDFNGGKLAYCDSNNFEQAKCHPDLNFKPLDCESYPFAPFIKDDQELVLLIDAERCPLPTRQLQNHHDYILNRWKQVLELNPKVIVWIKALSLAGYIPYRAHP